MHRLLSDSATTGVRPDYERRLPCAWTMLGLVAAVCMLARSANASDPTATITAPTEATESTAGNSTTITLSGDVTSDKAIIYSAWGIRDDSTGDMVDEALFTGTSFSTTVTLTADTAGRIYTLLVGLVNEDGFDVYSATLTVTKEAVECDADDFECQVSVLWIETEAALLAVIDEWQTTVQALIDAGDYAGATAAAEAFDDEAKALVKAADSVAKDLEKVAKEISKELKDAVKDIRKFEKKLLDKARKLEKKLMDQAITEAQCGATNYVCLAQSTADFARINIKDVLDVARTEYKEVLDDGKDDVKALFLDVTITQVLVDEAYVIKNEAEADALEFQADADIEANAQLTQAVIDVEAIRDQATGGDVATIQAIIDTLITDMTVDIDAFNDKALIDEIPDKVQKIQDEIDDAEAQL